jgi:long-subunit acyl-CoA synthetase (AMP-forming)
MSGVEEAGVLVSYLPFAHIAERVLSPARDRAAY